MIDKSDLLITIRMAIFLLSEGAILAVFVYGLWALLVAKRSS